MKIGLIQYLQTFAILKICYYMKILIYLNYNWVPGLPEQAGAELGQAQLDLSSLTQLEEILAANKLELKLRWRTKLLYSLQQNFISGEG